MTTTATVSVPLNKLVAWEGNVRITDNDKGIDALAASIEAHGLLQSLVVRKRKDGKFEIVAGQRRFKALKKLEKAKKITGTYAVQCHGIDAKADATEISLVENVQREQMHPADEFLAFKKMIDGGKPSEDVAAHFGVTRSVVEKRMKLANVSPALIKAYRNDELTLEHMMAFAVTSDHKAQEKFWKEEGKRRYLPDPDEIRTALTEGEITADDRRVKFVTLAAYEKAGGPVRRDLFTEGDAGTYIMDPIVLSALVREKLEKSAESVKKEGWKWVEVREKMDQSEWSRCSRHYEEADPLPPKKQAELDKLQKEYDKLCEADDGEEDNPRLDELNEKIEKLEDRPKSWRPETLAIAGAVVSIGWNGKAEVERGFVKAEDKPKATKTVKKTQEDGSVTEEQVEQAFSLSASLTESLTTHRTAALSAALKDKPEIALAALVHTLASDVFYRSSDNDTCLQISFRDPWLKGIEGSKAHTALEKAKEQWTSKLPSEQEKFWDWCLKQKQPVLLELLAYCVATSVNAVQEKMDRPDAPRFRHADQLAKAVKLDMAHWFNATAENYFGRISKTGILEALKEAKVQITPAMEKAKKGELAAIAEREVGPMKWLPETLRGPAP